MREVSGGMHKHISDVLNKDEDVTYIKMSKLKDGSLNAGVRDYEMIQYSIDDEHEVR